MQIAEVIKRIFDRTAGQIQPFVTPFYRLKPLQKFFDANKRAIFFASMSLLFVAYFGGEAWPAEVRTVMLWLTAGAGTGALLVELVGSITRAPAPTRRLSRDFIELILSFREAATFVLIQNNDVDLFSTVAKLEHDAFYGPSRTPLATRTTRISKWLSKANNLAQLIYFQGELIGYSVIIPVSEEQAKDFKEGLATEWFFKVEKPLAGQGSLTLYAQSIFIKHRLHGDQKTLGLAQSAALHHVIALLREYAQLVFGSSTSDDVAALLRRTTILADEGSTRGGAFMKHVGFRRWKKKTANNRNIWELSFSTPAAEGTALSQARYIIAKALGTEEYQVRAPEGTLKWIARRVESYIGFRP